VLCHQSPVERFPPPIALSRCAAEADLRPQVSGSMALIARAADIARGCSVMDPLRDERADAQPTSRAASVELRLSGLTLIADERVAPAAVDYLLSDRAATESTSHPVASRALVAYFLKARRDPGIPYPGPVRAPLG
jgi:hypothetical protein